MTTLARRILSVSFSVGFVIIAIPLFATTAGFRFDWSHFRFQKTGLLVIEAQPYPDRLFLDGKPIRPRGDPLRLTFIPPGSHTVRMEKEDYAPWEASASVTPGQATRLNAARLVRDVAPIRLATNVTTLCANDDGTAVAFAEGPRVSMLKPPATALKALVTLPEPIRICMVAGNGTYVFARTATTVSRITTADGAIVTIAIAPSTNHVAWDTEHPDRGYALSDDHRLYLLDFALTTLAPLTDRVLGMTLHDGTLFMVKEGDGNNEVVSRSADGTERVIGPLPFASASWTLIAPSDDALPVISEQQTLYMMSLSKGSPTMTVDGVTTATWSPNGNILATSGTLELNLVYPQRKTSKLLLRTSTPYGAASWVDDAHLLALHGDALEWLEAPDGELRTITTLQQRPVSAFLLAGADTAVFLQNGELLVWALT